MTESTRPEKELSTAIAEAMYHADATLQAIEDDRGNLVYVLTKGPRTYQLRTLEEVRIWVQRLGGKRA